MIIERADRNRFIYECFFCHKLTSMGPQRCWLDDTKAWPAHCVACIDQMPKVVTIEEAFATVRRLN